jgi:aminopeptidase N
MYIAIGWLWLAANATNPFNSGDVLRDLFKHPSYPQVEQASSPPYSTAEQTLLASNWDIEHYTHDLNFDLAGYSVAVETTIILSALVDGPNALQLNAVDIDLQEVFLDGESIEFSTWSDGFSLDLGERDLGDRLTISLNYESKINETNGYGINWNGNVLNSFHEPHGAKRWLITRDEPWDKATLDWIIEVPANLVVAANGELVSHREFGGRGVWEFEFNQPISTYLMVVHAAEYVLFEQEGDEGLPINHYLLPRTRDLGESAFETTPEILSLLSEKFGDYPWQSYGNAIAPMGGAMEHTTMTSFGEDMLDSSRAEHVNAHEVAHHWWGNWVTLSTWADIWLNEGFASYSEAVWYESIHGEDGLRDYVGSQMDSYLAWHDYEGYFALYDPAYSWGGTVYDKGAVVLDMLRTHLGDELFFGALQYYGEEYAYENATTAEFEIAVEQYTGQDLIWFFDAWVYRVGEPSILWGYESRELAEGGYQFDFRVEQTASDFDGVLQLWGFPLEVVIVDSEGEENISTFWVEQENQVFSLCVDYEVDRVLVDPDRRVLLGEIVEGDGQLGEDVCGENLGGGVDTAGGSDTGGDNVNLTGQGGCGCSSVPNERSNGWWALAFVTMFMTVRRRRV